jgi:hypothetical protein
LIFCHAPSVLPLYITLVPKTFSFEIRFFVEIIYVFMFTTDQLLTIPSTYRNSFLTYSVYTVTFKPVLRRRGIMEGDLCQNYILLSYVTSCFLTCTSCFLTWTLCILTYTSCILAFTCCFLTCTLCFLLFATCLILCWCRYLTINYYSFVDLVY